MPCCQLWKSGRWTSEADSCLSNSLLSPIGEHRSRNVTPSKGKRARKRKRKDVSIIKDQSAALSEEVSPEADIPVWQKLHDHLTVGFNTTTRYLESLAKSSSLSTEEKLDSATSTKSSARLVLNPADIKPLTAIFVPRTSRSPILHSHLPLLTKAAYLAAPSSPSTRIILLPEEAEVRLKMVLGIPRVGMVGLMDGAPEASSLIELIRQEVPVVEVPWLQESLKGVYLAVKVKATPSGMPHDPKRETATSTSATASID